MYFPTRYTPVGRRRGGGPFAREGRRLANRFVRDFAFAVAIFAVMIAFSLVKDASRLDAISLFQRVPHTDLNRVVAHDQFTIIDGDTIRLADEPNRLRLVGFNTPETVEPECAVE